MTNSGDWTSGLGTPSRLGSVRKTTLLLFLFLSRVPLCLERLRRMQEMVVVVILVLVAVGGGSEPGGIYSQRPHHDIDHQYGDEGSLSKV